MSTKASLGRINRPADLAANEHRKPAFREERGQKKSMGRTKLE
jgi:hypothetical protein